jgi:hypothetical protein
MPEEALNPELSAVANALAGLVPAPAQLDRDRLLYRAGQASVAGRDWIWPGATAALALLVIGLGLVDTLRPEPQRVTPTLFVRMEAPPTPESPVVEAPPPAERSTRQVAVADARPGPLSYLRMEQLAESWGGEALPRPSRAMTEESSAEPVEVLDLKSSNRLLEVETP